MRTAGGDGPWTREAWEVETLTTSRATLEASNGTEQLARFFPGVERAEVRAILWPRNSKAGTVEESVLVEYASPEHAIFLRQTATALRPW